MSKPFSDVTSTSHPARISAALLSALTEYDRKQSSKRSYNHYALGHYMNALNTTLEEVAAGKPLRSALVGHFTGRLLDVVLVAVQEPKSTDAEQRY